MGQSYDIEISREDGRWLIRIPEIDATTYAMRRTTVGAAARECIATRTGIPIGYIAVRVSN
ncbi:long chain fatty acid-CoA synthetase Faa4p [Mycolicibacterium komossense]|uniref:Long chain fatty acid-CoA synthetase Faa4p n=1 Tax=Mycolicibacterium komossense TaxID=1779 RepID=A0ABT3CII7_9MYCO|nr:long chain fatty acid-CoA synthetase Faa4p [Mycolicibacterium komossense]